MRSRRIKLCNSEEGFTLIELCVVLSMTAIIMTIGISNLRTLENTLENAAAQVSSFMKLARSKAISTTSAYTLRPVSPFRIQSLVGSSCGDPAPVADATLVLDLPVGSSLQDTDWSVCFNSRGFPDQSLSIDLTDKDMRLRTVEIFLGGGIR